MRELGIILVAGLVFFIIGAQIGCLLEDIFEDIFEEDDKDGEDEEES